MTLPQLPNEWHTPPVEFSLAPFWFLNDRLEEDELRRQMGEFQAHGVDAFVIHPRLGLPWDMGWMSDKLLEKIRFVLEEAQRRGMWVILYDEGMYPSGSSSGQVVAENEAYQCRGLIRLQLDGLQPNSVQQGIQIDAEGQPILTEHQTLIASVAYQGVEYVIIQRPIDSVIRGLHFIHEETDEPPEESPLAMDLLNEDAVACFVRLVYQRYYDEFSQYFGNTITAIFTDEPMLLGRPREKDIIPGTSGILTHVNDFLGYDFTPYLPALWDEQAPAHIRRDYNRAIENRLETTYYSQLYRWCEDHEILLTGHPAEPDATRLLKYFHIPGQDIVWRQVEPDNNNALEGRQSTQGKAASSMMLHHDRRRNANEFCGAFGHSLTFEEMQWLANWLLIRGCNLLIPHAFYYSVRGPRLHERPPDVGLHSGWWDERFTAFADGSRRLCWLNTDSEFVTHMAILGEHHQLPWRAAKDCFQQQIAFNYLDFDDLLQHTTLHNGALHIGNQTYRGLIVDGQVREVVQQKLIELAEQLPVIYWTDDADACVSQVRSLLPVAEQYQLHEPDLRIQHIRKSGFDWYVLFNEGSEQIENDLQTENAYWLNPYSDEMTPFNGHFVLDGYALRVLVTRAI